MGQFAAATSCVIVFYSLHVLWSVDAQSIIPRHLSNEASYEKYQKPTSRRQLIPSIGDNIRSLVLLVQFPEDRDISSLPTRDYFDTLCNEQIVPYFRAQSYGLYNITGCDVQEWRMTEYSQELYANSVSNLVGSEFASSFFLPILRQLDEEVITDWSVYDADADGRLDAVIALHSGYAAEYRRGAECNASHFSNRIHSQGHADSSGDWYNETVDGYRPWTNIAGTVSLSGYAIASVYDFVCTDTLATPGVMTHEWIHILGTPDLYGRNPNLTKSGVGGLGSYDIMSNARGPLRDGALSSLSAFSKVLLGWMEPSEINSDGLYTLSPSNWEPSVFVIRHPQFANDEYLLIEYRIAMGYDATLFGGGVIIYHVDDNQRSQGISTYPNSTEAHFRVALLQADGRYDIELGTNNGDANDFWNVGMVLGPNAENTLNTDSYYHGTTGLYIRIVNITENDATSLATIQITGMETVSNPSTSPGTISPGIVETSAPSSHNPTISPTKDLITASVAPSSMVSTVPSDIPAPYLFAPIPLSPNMAPSGIPPSNTPTKMPSLDSADQAKNGPLPPNSVDSNDLNPATSSSANAVLEVSMGFMVILSITINAVIFE
jgi:M6 family metalloprotease-like protein